MDRHMRASKRLVLVWVAIALAMTGGMAGVGGVATAQDEKAGDRASVAFTELNDSGLSGTAELTARGERTNVSMRINGAVGEHPTHIHTGSCDDLDPNPKYPLNNVELNTTALVGMSDSVVDVPLDEIISSDHLILIHRSPEELNTYYACGDVVADTTSASVAEDAGGGSTREADASTAGKPAEHALGKMGSGPMGEAGGRFGQAGGFGFVAIALALVALTLRRRAFRG
jgi:hypothetical protein